MNTTTLLQQALDALEGTDLGLHYHTRDAIRAHLAQPVQSEALTPKKPCLHAPMCGCQEAGHPCVRQAAQPAPAEPVASLIRYRRCTPASVAWDGQRHWHDWGDWQVATLKHGQAVTDPTRNPTEDGEWQMEPLYRHPPAQPTPVPAAWVDPRNIASAKVSQDRGGPFDAHVWSEGKTAIHTMPLYAAQPAPVPRKCTQCPHDVGDAYQRDCVYPDCESAAPVPLTRDQIATALAPLYKDAGAAAMGLEDDIATARAIERAHGIAASPEQHHE